jgi:DNA-binding response OmpR family regulator
MKLLIIEDDERIAIPLKEDLEHQKYVVELAVDGEMGLEMALSGQYELILLDLMLPHIDGMTVCRRLRQAGCNSAVIMITARDLASNMILGLDSGADDYLVKPFNVEELGARIRAVLRRGRDAVEPVLKAGELSLNPSSCITSYDLTPTEYRLLAHFMGNPHRAYSKQELITRLWSSDDEITNDSVIKTHIKGLRGKLTAVGAPKDIVETVYGIGYRLKSES